MKKTTEAEQNRLIVDNMGLVAVIAAEFRGAKGIPFDELVAEGRVGLVAAARSGRARNFQDYARECIKNSIRFFIKNWEELVARDADPNAQIDDELYEWDVFPNGFPYESWTNLSASPEELAMAFDDLCHNAATLAALKAALKFQPKRDRQILKARFLRDEPQTLESIARDHKISYAMVVKILNRVLKRLRVVLENKVVSHTRVAAAPLTKQG